MTKIGGAIANLLWLHSYLDPELYYDVFNPGDLTGGHRWVAVGANDTLYRNFVVEADTPEEALEQMPTAYRVWVLLDLETRTEHLASTNIEHRVPDLDLTVGFEIQHAGLYY